MGQKLAVSLVIILAVLVVAVLYHRAPGSGRSRTISTPRVAAELRPPVVAPVELVPIDEVSARKINADVPFVPGPILLAKPFVFTAPEPERDRAIACLATAVWYEAGDDAIGERAVAQVVLNRVRHPAFPHSVCGVVFQGAERTTGCQFTFACDGSIARHTPSPQAWARAQEIAKAAISGLVVKEVGTATHYHTDWVIPYWSASLDKVAAVDTHLFFRWRGWWGTPAAFRSSYAGPEIIDPRIAALAGEGAQLDYAALAAGDDRAAADSGSAPMLQGNIQRLADNPTSTYLLQLNSVASAAGLDIVSRNLCGGRKSCVVFGWLDGDKVPQALPIPAASQRAVSFRFERMESGRERALWNCQEIVRLDRDQCLPGTAPSPTSAILFADEASATYLVQLDPAAYPGRYAVTALGICGKKADCVVMGWIRREDVPPGLPIGSRSQGTLAFRYDRSSHPKLEQARWNCRKAPRSDASQCLPGTGAKSATSDSADPHAKP